MENNKDKELLAMQGIINAIENIKDDPEMVSRVLNWSINKFKVITEVRAERNLISNSETVNPIKSAISNTYASLPDFLSLLYCDTDAERALAVAYYLQVIDGREELSAKDINNELKHLGYESANITVAMSRLMKKKPQLIIQLRKQSNSRVAKKVYRVSTQGVKYIENKLINHPPSME